MRAIVILLFFFFVDMSYQKTKTKSEETVLAQEIAAGDMSALLGSGAHYSLPQAYANNDLGRRFIPEYQYTEKKPKVVNLDENDNDKQTNSLEIVKAPPEVVIALAKQSLLLEKSKPVNPTEELIQKDALRTGDYWNAVWKEEVNPSALRQRKTKTKKATIKAKVMPGSKLYSLVSTLLKVSPRLLYVIYNKKHENYQLFSY